MEGSETPLTLPMWCPTGTQARRDGTDGSGCREEICEGGTGGSRGGWKEAMPEAGQS